MLTGLSGILFPHLPEKYKTLILCSIHLSASHAGFEIIKIDLKLYPENRVADGDHVLHWRSLIVRRWSLCRIYTTASKVSSIQELKVQKQ
jgi:hypothetical protein